MAQTKLNWLENPTGGELMDTYLFPLEQNIISSNSGTARPSYAVKGTLWMDTSVEPHIYKMYDGQADIIVGYVNTVDDTYSPVGGDSLANTDLSNLTPTGLTAFAKTDFSNTNLYKVLPHGTALNTVIVNGKYRIVTISDTPISGAYTWWVDVAEEGNGTLVQTAYATGAGAHKGMVRFTRRYVANQGWESWQVVGGRALIKSAKGSQNWYNIYLELVGGTEKFWCEQGGSTEFVQGGTSATINYLIPIVNNYTTIITPTISGTLGTGLVYYKGTTTTSMTVQNNTNSPVIFEWLCVATCNRP